MELIGCKVVGIWLICMNRRFWHIMADRLLMCISGLIVLLLQHGSVSEYTERSRSESVDCCVCCSRHWHDDTSSVCRCRPHLTSGKFADTLYSMTYWYQITLTDPVLILFIISEGCKFLEPEGVPKSLRMLIFDFLFLHFIRFSNPYT